MMRFSRLLPVIVLLTGIVGAMAPRPSFATLPHPHALVLTASSGNLGPGSERLLCDRNRAPAHGMEFGRIRIVMPGDGGHHVALFRPHAGTLQWPPRQCPFP